MTSDSSSSQNVPPVNEADKSSWHTIGCRIRPSDLFLVDRAVMEIRHRSGRLNYSRSDFISEAVIRRAMQVLEGEPAPSEASA